MNYYKTMKKVAKKLGEYVIKHYFCTRIRERTLVIKYWIKQRKKVFRKKTSEKFGSLERKSLSLHPRSLNDSDKFFESIT